MSKSKTDEIYINNVDSLNIIINLDNNIYSFYTDKYIKIGSFSMEQLIKFLIEDIDIYNQFLTNITLNKSEKELISTNIFKFKQTGNMTDIVLLNYTESAFMGDIESLIKLNNILGNFENNKMNAILDTVDDKNVKKIRSRILKFIYLMLNHTLYIISVLSSQNIQNELASYLIKFSTMYMLKINKFIETDLVSHIEAYDNLQLMNNKYDELQKELDTNIILLDQKLLGNNKKLIEMEALLNEYRRRDQLANENSDIESDIETDIKTITNITNNDPDEKSLHMKILTTNSEKKPPEKKEEKTINEVLSNIYSITSNNNI